MPKHPPLSPAADRRPTRAEVLAPSDVLAGARRLPLDLIDANPAQSRQVFDEAALEELAASIRQEGVLQPIVVRPVAGRYQIAIGERRARAARLAGLTEIPALIRELTDEQAAWATAAENLQRADLDLEDEARWFAHLQEVSGLSGRQLAERLGKSVNYVNRRLLLLQHPDLLAAVRAGTLTQREALDQAGAGASGPAPIQGGSGDTPESPAPADVIHGGSVLPMNSISTAGRDPQRISADGETGAAAPLAERAALDGGRDTRPVPYRARAFETASVTLRRMDWASVPAAERAQVRLELVILRAALEAAEAVLGSEA